MNSGEALQPGQLNEMLAAIRELCQKTKSQGDPAARFQPIAREAARLMQAELASIFLLDLEWMELCSLATLDGKEIRLDARLGFAGRVAMTGQPITVHDAQHDSRFYPRVDERTGVRTRSLLAVPLLDRQGMVIGTLQALNKIRGAFERADEELLKAIAVEVSALLAAAKGLEKPKPPPKDVGSRFSTQNILGTSERIQQVIRRVEQISDSELNVLITGESGTGKEMVAKAIHYSSPRLRGPFVALNCAAVAKDLLESELFGHEKGAFTGALERRIGLFEEASGGTLFLDEIGDMELGLQAKLLRALQEREIRRVGGRGTIPVNARVLAATNRNPQTEMQKGTFRSDLYYRLNVIRISMPALREIPQDIPLLANAFLERHRREMRKSPMKFSARALNLLASHAWPGNIRELDNEIKRIVVCTRHTTITEEDLSEAIRRSDSGTGKPLLGSLKDKVADLERRMIREQLTKSQGNVQKAAKLLGLSRQGLIKKLKRYGMKARS